MSGYRTLVTQLRAAPTMVGVGVQYGEESIADESVPTPRIILVPIGGPVSQPAYSLDTNPSAENQWSSLEQCDVYMHAWSNSPNAGPVDHANEVEILRQRVLSAFQWQMRNQDPQTGLITGGLYCKPISLRWLRFGDATVRYGRCCVLTVTVDIPMVDESFQYQDATILQVDESASIVS